MIRRTKACLIYRRTKNIRAVQLLLGHSKLESTVRYLGTEVEDALELSEQTEIRAHKPSRNGQIGCLLPVTRVCQHLDASRFRRQSGCSGQRSHRPTADIRHLIKTHYE